MYNYPLSSHAKIEFTLKWLEFAFSPNTTGGGGM